MAKLETEVVKRLKEIGVNAKTEEEAKKKLLSILAKSGVDGMDDEDLDTLIDIAESFVDEPADNDDDDETDTDTTTDSEGEDLASEAEEDEASEAEEEPEAEENDEPEEEEDDSDEFDGMNRTELKKYIKENGLNVRVMKKMSDDDIREAIRTEILNNTDDEDEEEEETPKEEPVKVEKKKEEKAAKVEKSKPAKTEKKEEKAKTKRGNKLDPKINEEDRSEFDKLHELFPEDEFVYAWLATSGVTIKHKGTNSNRSVITVENCTKQSDGTIKCNLYLLTFTKQKDVLDEAGIDYQPCWNGAPAIKGVSLDEVIEIVKGLMDNILASVKKIDKKLGENRKKMEENLEKKSSPKTTGKVATKMTKKNAKKQ